MKPVVKYTHTLSVPVVGLSAVVWPLDHPSAAVSNTKYAITSRVVSVDVDGFETVNTTYRREDAH